MNIKATYTPPPPTAGTVTLTLDEATAQKLLALLGQCTSEIFTPIYRALDDALPEKGRLNLKLGTQPDHATRPVISLGASYGAGFAPRD